MTHSSMAVKIKITQSCCSEFSCNDLKLMTVPVNKCSTFNCNSAKITHTATTPNTTSNHQKATNLKQYKISKQELANSNSSHFITDVSKRSTLLEFTRTSWNPNHVQLRNVTSKANDSDSPNQIRPILIGYYTTWPHPETRNFASHPTCGD